MSPGADHAKRAAELMDLAWSEYAEASEGIAEAQVHATLAVWAALTAITDNPAGSAPTDGSTTVGPAVVGPGGSGPRTWCCRPAHCQSCTQAVAS